VLDERRLERMQLVAVGQPLDRRDLGALVGDRQRQAAVRPPPVQQHGARAVSAMATIRGVSASSCAFSRTVVSSMGHRATRTRAAADTAGAAG
jgi:hypothetical protein